jgi:hypothetical protein
VTQLINRRKLYPGGLRDTFERLYTLRQTADYEQGQVSQVQANRAVRRARELVEAVQASR